MELEVYSMKCRLTRPEKITRHRPSKSSRPVKTLKQEIDARRNRRLAASGLDLTYLGNCAFRPARKCVADTENLEYFTAQPFSF